MATAEHSAAYRERRKQQRDEIRFTIWVPRRRADEFRAFVAKLEAEEDLEKKRPSKPPPVVVPKVEIPGVQPPGWSYLRIAEDELALRMIVKANGGQWINGGPQKTGKTWKLRSDLVDKLGLRPRVVHERSARGPGGQHGSDGEAA